MCVSSALFPLQRSHVILLWELRKMCKGFQVDELLIHQSLQMRSWPTWRLFKPWLRSDRPARHARTRTSRLKGR